MLYAGKTEKMPEWDKKYGIEQKRMTGFLAQQVAKVAQQLGYDFSGVTIPENGNDLYTLSYAQFVVPLVKAVQEQQQMIANQRQSIEQLKTEIEQLMQMIKQQ